MTRDEILAAIDAAGKSASPDPSYTMSPDEIQADMRSVVALADEYDGRFGHDVPLCVALRDAMERFADHLQPYA